ncbi:TatD family hydrolase [Lederbergia lenta]|uniref:Mg-dependent deoxyribonuclease n=1 Tax=Lederbergia lenta TaxID=1467 RepID=A0A2X4W6H0_LEDLE|nr:TatD family hydrolase [Lederbergia lenta]MCM3112320.1 TatD family hydrolase [Lederbergia lenta]MEC2326540.1 TatD family hydrolase [Lederbergia lenta]SQI53210.1 Mg-dependent deoxyribonuclease [Lederbergia lenta]
MNKMIDSHIHLDHYSDEEIELILTSLDEGYCEKLISVSYDLKSCKRNLKLANKHVEVMSAFGFHPEQELPSEHTIKELFSWMEKNKDRMVAIGEVGLPYYFRTENKSTIKHEAYIELLDAFLKLASQWDKPVILHAVYDDAPIVCDLLEKHYIQNAHFHWFKGDNVTIERMIRNGYYISITPDVLYEQEIQELVKKYPLEQLMVETDGPWPFEGIFTGKMTEPKMIHESISVIAELKKEEITKIYKTIYGNTKNFYRI